MVQLDKIERPSSKYSCTTKECRKVLKQNVVLARKYICFAHHALVHLEIVREWYSTSVLKPQGLLQVVLSELVKYWGTTLQIWMFGAIFSLAGVHATSMMCSGGFRLIQYFSKTPKLIVMATVLRIRLQSVPMSWTRWCKTWVAGRWTTKCFSTITMEVAKQITMSWKRKEEIRLVVVQGQGIGDGCTK